MRKKQSSGLFFSPREILRTGHQKHLLSCKAGAFSFVLLFCKALYGNRTARPAAAKPAVPAGWDSPADCSTGRGRFSVRVKYRSAQAEGAFFSSVRGIAAQATAARGGSSLPAQKKNRRTACRPLSIIFEKMSEEDYSFLPNFCFYTKILSNKQTKSQIY